METKNISPKLIAFYLPQFHPIPENNAWWGDGFTEWHNVAKARPLFRAHDQPRLPGELGFYDLRLDRTRCDQAELARQHGVFGFCYWHYWFDGKRLLEQPLEAVLTLKTPDFPFCLGWANETWTGIWHGAPRKILAEQTYSEGDADRHYDVMRRSFHDARYIRQDGRPLLFIYKPRHLPVGGQYIRRLRELAKADGFPDLFVVGNWTPNPSGRFDELEPLGLDAAAVTNLSGRESHSALHWTEAVKNKAAAFLPVHTGPKRLPYQSAVDFMLPNPDEFPFPVYNTVISNWDNTPRSGRRGLVLTGATPELFRDALKIALNNLANAKNRAPGDFIFLKSWNEWAEGNFVEPDQKYGRAYLEAIRAAMNEFDNNADAARSSTPVIYSAGE